MLEEGVVMYRVKAYQDLVEIHQDLVEKAEYTVFVFVCLYPALLS
jgi:hypothetical protein